MCHLFPLGVVLAPPIDDAGALKMYGRLLPDQMLAHVLPAAERRNVPAALLMSALWEESTWQKFPKARTEGHTAQGIAQTEVGTREQFGCFGNPYDISNAVDCMARILDAMHRKCERHDPQRKYWAKAVAAYYVGTSTCPSIKRGHVQRTIQGKAAWEIRLRERG